MRINSSHELKCDHERVWDKLMDIDVLSNIISGSKGLKEIGENEFQGRLPIKLGPIKGRVKTRFKLVEINKPKSFRLIVKSKDSKMPFTGDGVFRLKQKENVVTVRYTGEAHLGGAIGHFGKSKAKQTLKKALKKLFTKIEKLCCEESEYAH